MLPDCGLRSCPFGIRSHGTWKKMVFCHDSGHRSYAELIGFTIYRSIIEALFKMILLLSLDGP